MRRTALLLCCALLGLAACGPSDTGAITGYVEGLYLRPAPTAGGRITTLLVERGADVTAGQPLFAMDAEREQAAVTEATQRVGALQARLADLETGARAEELAVIRAQLQQAQAASRLSQATQKRQQELAAKGLASVDARDAANAAATRDAARVAELQRQLDVAVLSGRKDALAAARAEIEAAQAQLAQARWALAQKSISAPAAGRIEDVYFRAGEVVNAGQPVLALLPPENRRLRFFVPQARLAEFAAGQRVRASCEACGEPIHATVRFVASEAEFTPPVLFDRRQRARLVYRVEALAAPADALRLHPGQPVDVNPAGT